MSINWGNLRPWDGSQHSAFEELCCQLAESEHVPPGSRFVRKGAPDAGVECFWTLPRACYGPTPRTAVAWRRKRQAKTTKCNPAKVVGSLS